MWHCTGRGTRVCWSGGENATAIFTQRVLRSDCTFARARGSGAVTPALSYKACARRRLNLEFVCALHRAPSDRMDNCSAPRACVCTPMALWVPELAPLDPRIRRLRLPRYRASESVLPAPALHLWLCASRSGSLWLGRGGVARPAVPLRRRRYGESMTGSAGTAPHPTTQGELATARRQI